ncbi:branched-chain amino acid ABC transporter permease [Actinomadura sp. NBRC 104412]|uniref:branched-chain amino acid ABC transporter permease n=1 Tax=Actinomadura sp. NBRC 104412 TaxID=3032203 RepID=UPI0024A450EB|nr:branched-chain amino acid ABC transporter permease [Actinomadura sp. NBRC 104412]GLZ02606.1 branched-chain amino acid ABC transporter permease [Actinomadura sp. NBRC 104412]
MTQFIQQLVIGLSDGTIFAVLGLALVVVNRVTGTINFAQGEMATLSAFVAWTMSAKFGWPYALAFAFALVVSFVLGSGLQAGLVRPVAKRGGFGLILLTIGLFYLVNGVTGMIWGYSTKSFPSPFDNRPVSVLGVYLPQRQIAILVIAVALVVMCAAFFRLTTFGLAMRAAALQPTESELLGISVLRVQTVGWGIAASVGAVAGILVAPVQTLEPNMLQPPLLFAFAAVVLGGTDSMVGSVIGGLIVGLIVNFSNYLMPDLQTLNAVIAFGVIVAVLYVKPNGLFGRPVAHRA